MCTFQIYSRDAHIILWRFTSTEIILTEDFLQNKTVLAY